MAAKETIVVVVGAGASGEAGISNTAELTKVAKRAMPTIVVPGVAYGPTAQQNNRTILLADVLDQALAADYGANCDFEILLHALEQIEAFVGPRYTGGEPNANTPVLGSFAELMRRYDCIDDESMLHQARLNVLEAIHHRVGSDCDHARNAPRDRAAKDQLNRIFEKLAERYRVIVIDFNYDVVLDRLPSIQWNDGFTNVVGPGCLMFSPDDWRQQVDDSDAHLLMHLHGSATFGYQPFGLPTHVSVRYAEPAKYDTISAAQASLKLRGMSGTIVGGNIEDASYIVSGVGKAGKVTYNARPYGYYFRTIMDFLTRTERLLILGYSHRDYHVNTWINEYVGLRPNRRTAVVTHRTGDMVGDNTSLEYQALARIAEQATWSRIETFAYARRDDERNAGAGSRFRVEGNFAIAPEGFVMEPDDEKALIGFITI